MFEKMSLCLAVSLSKKACNKNEEVSEGKKTTSMKLHLNSNMWHGNLLFSHTEPKNWLETILLISYVKKKS